jgi:membrane protease YdiL (CAAX protease family)
VTDPFDLIESEPSGIDRAPARSRLGTRMIALGELLLCSSVPTQFVIAAVLVSAGLGHEDGAGLSLPFVAVLSLADSIVLIGLMVVLTRLHGEHPSALWVGDRPAGREMLGGLMLVPLVFAFVAAVLTLLRLGAPWLHNVETNPLEQLATRGVGEAALVGLVAVIAGGVREELQRAFLLQRFERHLGGAAVGVVVGSAGFGLLHALQGWDAVVTTTLLGAFWAVVYLRRRSTLAPIVSHAGFNALEVLRVALTGQGQG